MAFKRQEGFRFSFGDPVEASFIVLTDEGSNEENNEEKNERLKCKVLDISPRGMKVLTDVNLNKYAGARLEVLLSLDTTEITALADVVWTKAYGANFQYGLIFDKQPGVEELIIEELKIRRRKEIGRIKSKS